MAERIRERLKKADKANLAFYITIVLFCIALFVLRAIYHPVSVVGSSMSPTYQDGDILITTKNYTMESLKHDDIIVFYSAREGHVLIKRIIGLPGETVSVKNGEVYVDGVKRSEFFPDIERPGILSDSYLVPANSVFVLGDNRNDSVDSRSFGAVAFEDIRGVVIRRIF